MNEFFSETRIPAKRNPVYEIVLLVIFWLMGLFVGNFVGVLMAWIFLGFNKDVLLSILANPTGNPASWYVIMALQGIPSLGAFIIAPFYFNRIIAKQPIESLNSNKHLWLIPALLCVVLIIAFMPFNALFIEWNSKMDLPHWLGGLERWMQEKEGALKELTEYLTSFNTIPQLLIGFIVIALIPAIGEELVFRGLVQPRVFRLTKNVHAAVWITGFIFSAIHFQFYGLFPRMLLGAVLGYLYAWSGNLWYPIIGHFTNNGFMLLMIYLYNNKTTDIDIEATTSVSAGTALLSLLFCVVVLFTLKQYYFKDRRLNYE